MPEAMKTLRMTTSIINKNGRSSLETGLFFASFGQTEPRNFAGLKPDELDGDLILEPFLEIGQSLIEHRRIGGVSEFQILPELSGLIDEVPFCFVDLGEKEVHARVGIISVNFQGS